MRREVGLSVKVALAATFTALIAGWPGIAWAEGELVSSAPAAGEALPVAPVSVTLVFGVDLWYDESHVAVLDSAGANVVSGELIEEGRRRLRVPVAIGSVGDFTVAYHVSFAGGTMATGAYRFSAGTGIAPAMLDDQLSRAAADAVTVHPHSVDGFSALLLIIDGAVLLSALFLLWLRPGRKRPMSLRAALEQDR